jgi:transposase
MLWDTNVKVWLSTQPTDMRKATNGLSQLVVENFKSSPQCGDVFIFYNRGKNKSKVLFWHYNGFCLLYKRLEKDLFKMPADLSAPLQLNYQQLNRLLEGLHFVTESHNKFDIFY